MKKIFQSFLALSLLVAPAVVADCNTGSCESSCEKSSCNSCGSDSCEGSCSSTCESSCESSCGSCNVRSVFRPRPQGADTARELLGWQILTHKFDVCDTYLTAAMTFQYERSFHGNKIAQGLFGTDTLKFVRTSQYQSQYLRHELLFLILLAVMEPYPHPPVVQ